MDKETEEKIVELRKAGWKYSDLMKEFNICNNTLQDALKRHSLVFTAEDRKKRDEKIIEVSKANRGLCASEVAEILCLDVTTVARVRRNAGLSFQCYRHRKPTEEERRKQSEAKKTKPEDFFARYDIPFDYVDGFDGVDSMVRLKCRKCGNVFNRSCVSIRKGRQPTCPYCVEQRAEEKKKVAIQNKEKREKEKRRQREEIKRQREEAKRLQIEARLSEDKICKECGIIFHSLKNNAFCSPECAKKHANRRGDKRVNKKNRVDSDITLRRLYDRDKGICYICGGKCDYNDFQIRDGAFICGDCYPSIDHVKPLSKGGKHEWSNVRLAHFWCNTKKSNRKLNKNNCVGQMSLPI